MSGRERVTGARRRRRRGRGTYFLLNKVHDVFKVQVVVVVHHAFLDVPIHQFHRLQDRETERSDSVKHNDGETRKSRGRGCREYPLLSVVKASPVLQVTKAV